MKKKDASRRKVIGIAVLVYLLMIGLITSIATVATEKQGRMSHIIPLKDLYDLSALIVPTERECLVSESYCLRVYVTAARAEIPPLGYGIAEQKVIDRLAVT